MLNNVDLVRNQFGRNTLLLISYKFVEGFLAITFLLLVFLTETFMMYVNVFYIVRNKISVGSDKK